MIFFDRILVKFSILLQFIRENNSSMNVVKVQNLHNVCSHINYRRTKLSFCFWGITVFNQTVTAQRTALDSVQIIQDNRSLDVYGLTQNVIYVEGLRPQKGYASANIFNEFGGFRQPMQASSMSQYKAETGGFKKMNHWGYNGHFAYKKTYENTVKWSGVYDAYDDNPFIWADSSQGNWQRDEIKAKIGIIPPKITKNLSMGLQINYFISSGARLSEPKPFYRYRNIALQPALNYQLNQNQSLGIMGTIGFVVEENELGFYGNSGNNVLLYRLRGYGTFSKSPFVSGERKRIQDDLAVRIHYKKKSQNTEFLISAHASQRNDDITEGVALPQSIGFFTSIQYGGLVSFYKGNFNHGKSINLKISSKNGYADDVIFRAESASTIYQHLDIQGSKWHFNESKKTLTQFSITANYSSIDNTDQATRTKLLVSKIQFLGGINYRKQLNEKYRFNASVETGYSYVFDNSFVNRNLNTIIRELIIPNYLFHSSHFALFNAKLGMDIISKKSNITHSIFASTQNQVFTKFDTQRTNLQLNYSILF